MSQSSIVGGNTTASFASAYDAMGNLISDGIGLQLSYDATGRLARGAKGPQEMTARYNAMGQRMLKASGSQTRVYAVDEMGRPLGVYVVDANASNGFRVEEEYVHLDGWRPVAVIRPDASTGMANPQVFPILSDHLGTPRKVLDGATGQTRWSWDAKQPFGHEMPLETPTAGLPAFTLDLRFPGQRFDEETGLFHNGFRDYHPGLGRYVQSDPLGLEAGWNTYGYAAANPIDHQDPTGLKIEVRGDIFEYENAISYLKTSLIAKTIIELVENSPQTIVVNVSHSSPSTYLANSGTVTWSPSRAKYCYTDGGFASPANGLFHEIFHAYQALFNPSILKRQFSFNDSYNRTWFTKPAEKEAVEVSLLVAKSLGERGVYSHHGSFPTLPFEPIGVSSPVPINGKLYPSLKHKHGVNQNGQVIYEKIQ